MWFKNLQLFRLPRGFEYSAEQLHDKLQERAFRPCGTLEPASYGWVAPLGRDSEQLTHGSGPFIMVCARKEERVLPAQVVREELADKVADIEAQQARRVSRKEQQTLKDEIVQTLMPRAFTRSRLTYGYVDTRDGWLVVDAASAGKGEELVSLMRESLGSLPAQPPQTSNAPAAVMSYWVAGEQIPDGFSLGEECELRDRADEGGIVRCRRQDLLADEIQAHLNAGKQVVKLAVEWQERIACILGEDLTVKRLRFSDLVTDEAADADDAASRFDTDFAIMSLELSRFIPAVMDLFGGEDETSLTPNRGIGIHRD